MTNQAGAEQQAFVLGSDAPQTDPQHDAFGYAPFAERIAAAICTTQSPQGLVMAIRGPRGSGKSSLLNFVRFEVEASPERDRPLIIAFNPWWFSNRDDLVAQFLKQFREQLPKQSDAVKQLGNMLSEYSAALGTAVAIAVRASQSIRRSAPVPPGRYRQCNAPGRRWIESQVHRRRHRDQIGGAHRCPTARRHACLQAWPRP